MRIVIDGRMLRESGIGRYIRNLVTNLRVIDKKNEYFILLTKKDFNQLSFGNNFTKILADYRWYSTSEQIRLPGLLNSLKPDLVHFPHFNVPILYKGKFVVTIHDLIHQNFSMRRASTHGLLIYKIKQLGYRKVFKYATQKSQLILVPSDFVKRQLVKLWNVKKEKIVVTPEAVDDKLILTGKRMPLKLGQYIFYVGNAHPHKNVEGLIKAFLSLKEKCRDLKLVLAGNDHYFWQRIKKQYSREGILYKGYISDEELVNLYKNAKAFVMPSFEEGFGIPLLEAFASGCPVVSSNAGSLPEVGGNACLYFDPRSIVDMVDKISLVLNSEKLQKELIEKGFERVKIFSWQKLAQKTLEIYSKCV